MSAKRIVLLSLVSLATLVGPARPADPATEKFPDYQPVAGWPKLPDDVKLGAVSAVATDSTDRVFVFHRGKRPMLVFDRDGKFLRSWGDDHVKTAHGLRIDKDDNVWVTDIGNHQVMKFSPEEKLLLSLGKKGEAGSGPDQFDRPTDVAVTPSGEFYVSDGYGNSRVLKFSKDGKLLKQWGKKGTGEGEFNLPHAICLDPKGRVYVGDRENNRIQVFDGDGKFLAQWKEGGAPFGLFLTRDSRLFVADGRANWVKVLDLEGKALGRFGEKGKAPGQFTLPHMLCVDSQGAVYVAEVDGQRIQKFVPKTSGAFDWQKATPESQGMSAAKLAAMQEALAAKKTKAFMVIRNDKIVHEWYADGHSATATHYTASMAKALVGGVSLGVAMSDGRIGLDDRAAKYVPEWKDDAKKSLITIRQLGSHTAGLEDAHQDGVPHDKLPGWMGDFWKRLDPPGDPFTLARDKTPLADPGKKMHYSNPGIAMLSYAVTASLKDAPEKDIRTLLRDRVMRPIGVPDKEWSVGYGKTYTVDGLPLVAAWGGGSYSARASARVARLMLREGDWEGKQLLSKEAVRAITSDAGTPGNCGMGWWSNNDGTYAKLPRDAYWASGAGHQIVLVVPSLKLIVVRNGELLEAAGSEPAKYHESVRTLLFEPVIDAVTDPPAKGRAAPYPMSKVITRAEWVPKDTIVRKAKGSDNWPLTWADDGHLYTAYGDGWGFEPRVPEKLSLGFARVEGKPDDFTGVNLRSPTGEQKGDGKDGKKASGLLAVEGGLYLWARNAGNAQLAWSADRGKTWEWADWKFTTSFGCPTFLNFGKDYGGARDSYVYVYSHDSDSAYTPADRMVLARAPKDKVKQRDAYEFFTGLDAKGQPLWSKDVARRGAVFTHAGNCYRSGITYNAPLKRYLWCQTLPGKDARFGGGFGVYDAPEPWGPWTTVFFTPEWDVGPGESSSFPTKWMSADGKTLYLVFSGDDHFCVRKLTLTVAE